MRANVHIVTQFKIWMASLKYIFHLEMFSDNAIVYGMNIQMTVNM